MAELWEWEEAYILFQTAVMDESTGKNKNRRKSACLSLSPTRTQSSVALKSVHNRCDWNNGTPGGAVEV